MTDELDLSTRPGLPEHLRALVIKHPRAGWAAHPNFGPLTRFWLDRHLMFRRLGEQMRLDAQALLDRDMEARAFQSRLSRFGGMLVNQLHEHHHIEDEHYFPALQRREVKLKRGFEMLDKDHDAMDGLLHAFATAANEALRDPAAAGRFLDALGSFEAMLNRHLIDEEEIVVPVLLEHGEP